MVRPQCLRARTGYVLASTCFLRFNEDALAWALLGRLDNGIHLIIGEVREAFGALRVAFRGGEDLLTLAHVGESVVKEDEHVGGDFFADSISGAEILIDPDLHGLCPFAV
jgi:hypothetical protein